MTRGERKKDKVKGIWGMSAFAFTAMFAFFILIAMASFLFGEFFLFIRNPKNEVAVPDFTGMKFSTAESTAAKARLNVQASKFVFSNEVDKDYITEQEPAAGVKVKEGRTILLTVSKGKRDIEVPNLLGMQSSEANAKLEQLGLVPVEPQTRHSDVAEPGRVINQSPPAGSLVARGERILTIISKGPEIKNLEMPDLEGMSLEDAISITGQLGLRVSRVTRIYSATVSDERITSQAPIPGRPVKRGNEVILTLTVPSYKRVLGERQFRVAVDVPPSEKGIEVSIIKNDLNETREIYREVINGPARIEKLVDAYGATTISIYFDGNLYREETF